MRFITGSLLLFLCLYSWAQPAELSGINLQHYSSKTLVTFTFINKPEYTVDATYQPAGLIIQAKAHYQPKLKPPAAVSPITQLTLSQQQGQLKINLSHLAGYYFSAKLLQFKHSSNYFLIVELTQNKGSELTTTIPHGQVQSLVDLSEAPAEIGKKAMPAIVLIDPGHGGKDPGSLSKAKLFEKDLTLQLAKSLATELAKIPGIKPILTRESDKTLKLTERLKFVQQHDADLMVSIHADAFKDNRVGGASVYTLSIKGASSEMARLLSEQEPLNAVGGLFLKDYDVLYHSHLLLLSQMEMLNLSRTLASHVLGNLKTLGPLSRKGIESANFVVLRSPDTPSILIEAGFITNPQDLARLSSAKFQTQFGQSLAKAIKSYLMAHPPQGSYFAQSFVK